MVIPCVPYAGHSFGTSDSLDASVEFSPTKRLKDQSTYYRRQYSIFGSRFPLKSSHTCHLERGVSHCSHISTLYDLNISKFSREDVLQSRVTCFPKYM